MTTVRCVVEAQDRLGEGPCWSPADGRLYWFDILQRRLHWLEPTGGGRGAWELPMQVSAAAPRRAGGLIAAAETGLVYIDVESGTVEMAEAVNLPTGFRSNDGKIDSKGRFWWSVMDADGGARPGAVFRTDPGGATRRILDGIHIPNTLAVTADGATLFLSDSKAQQLRAYPIGADGELGASRVFADLSGRDGTPDGGALDAEGFLWNAQWGAWRVVRYSPDGAVDRVVELPIEQPTSCAFAGPGLATLFITSATDGLTSESLARQPLAGGLFAFEPGVEGLALPTFDG